MPDRRGPRFPQCHSELTERLPFLKGDDRAAVYSCNLCEHVWREPTAKPSDDKRDKVA